MTFVLKCMVRHDDRFLILKTIDCKYEFPIINLIDETIEETAVSGLNKLYGIECEFEGVKHVSGNDKCTTIFVSMLLKSRNFSDTYMLFKKSLLDMFPLEDDYKIALRMAENGRMHKNLPL